MDTQFENAFDPNNKFHVMWLKNLVNNKEGTLVHNPFGIQVMGNEMYLDIVTKLSKKFINSSVGYVYSDIFSYEYSYVMDGEYHDCRLLKPYGKYEKGTQFDYALVFEKTIHFFVTDSWKPVLVIKK